MRSAITVTETGPRASGTATMSCNARSSGGSRQARADARRFGLTSWQLAGGAFDVAAHNEMLDRFNGSVRDWMAPHGFGGANGMFALQTRLYMERFGATREDFGRLPVAQRTNALGNPNALFRNPLGMDDYLNARLIADPLRLYDCVLPCVGGDCAVMASERVAHRLRGPRVSILGGGEMHNHPANDVYALRAGWEAIAPRMYEQAAIGPRDLHFAQLYDDYPVMEASSSRASASASGDARWNSCAAVT